MCERARKRRRLLVPFEVVHLLRDKPAVAHRRASLAVSPRVLEVSRARVGLEPLCVDDCMASRPASIAAQRVIPAKYTGFQRLLPVSRN